MTAGDTRLVTLCHWVCDGGHLHYQFTFKVADSQMPWWAKLMTPDELYEIVSPEYVFSLS